MNKQDKGNGKRGIEWTDFTWNPVAGCQHQCRWTMPDGTEAICYAEDVAHGIAQSAYPNGFDAHYWKPHKLSEPARVKSPSRVFVGSMSDLFGHRVPTEQIEDILQTIREIPWHQFQLLTKNPVRIQEFDLPENVWVGVSMPPDFMWGKSLTRHQQKRMLHRMLSLLSDVQATVRWMSFEPLSWDVAPIVSEYGGVLDWAVIGAASSGRNYYPPSEEVFDNLLSVLDGDNVPVFYKGNLKSLPEAQRKWREEFPI